MNPKYKPLKNLYFQFVKDTPFDGVLEWQHVADAFNRSGLIELIPDNTGKASFSGYKETSKMRELTELNFETTINHVLTMYSIDQGLVDPNA